MSAALAAVLAACGGSGSTGLILPESVLFEEVRETRECRDANGTTYCFATNLAVEGMPLPDPAEPPCDDEVCPVGTTPFEFDTTRVAGGTTCAIATRIPEADWVLQPAQVVGGPAGTNAFVVSGPPEPDLGSDGFEAALLCFESPPDPLPDTLRVLADADPSVIFVAPLL